MRTSADLFPASPRRAPTKRMHVADAGCEAISFECHHCGHKTGWLMWNRRELTVTEAKRGLPCPKCNPDIKGKPMSLVEKVDAAIKNAIAKGQSPGRAAIEAMTEPTPEMLEEGSDPHGGLSVLQARSCWQSMIDAALKDGE